MSASTERKNRQTAREAGTHRKTLAQQKEMKKQKKDKVKWIIVAAALVVFFAFVIFVNTGAFYRTINGITIELEANEELGIGSISRSFSVAECNCAYNMMYLEYQQTLSAQYGEYAQYFSGVDTSKPFDEQPCTVTTEDENDTWDDYFTEQMRSYLTQIAVFEAYAEAHDISLSDEDIANIDEELESFDASAETYGYASADKLIAGNYGKGTNIEVLRSMMMLQQLGSRVSEAIGNGFTFTQDELTAKYDSVKDDYDNFTYSVYEVKAEVAEVGDTESDVAAAVPTEESLAEAKATADSILAKVEKGMSLADAAKEVVPEAEITEAKDTMGMQLPEEISEWLLDSERAEGDKTVIEGSAGAYVVVFTSRDNNQHPTEASGDKNYCDYVAETLLRQEKLNEWAEKTLEVYTDTAALDEAFGMLYVGR